MTCYVEQELYGHSVKKATWLYAVGVEPAPLPTEWRADQAGGKVRWSRVRYAGDETRPRVAGRELDATPPAFRDVLPRHGPHGGRVSPPPPRRTLTPRTATRQAATHRPTALQAPPRQDADPTTLDGGRDRG